MTPTRIPARLTADRSHRRSPGCEDSEGYSAAWLRFGRVFASAHFEKRTWMP